MSYQKRLINANQKHNKQPEHVKKFIRFSIIPVAIYRSESTASEMRCYGISFMILYIFPTHMCMA